LYEARISNKFKKASKQDSALGNLDLIAEYIALDIVDAAKKLIQNIFSNIELLINSPKLGRILPELDEGVYREILVGPCRVFQRIQDDEIIILHVMRSDRLLRKYILEERDKEDY